MTRVLVLTGPDPCCLTVSDSYSGGEKERATGGGGGAVILPGSLADRRSNKYKGWKWNIDASAI